MSSQAAAPSRRYAIVAPCRNEAKFMRRTLDSLVSQSTPPTLLVVVDDGSTDETPTILAEYASRYPFIRVVTRRDRGTRSVGPGVIEAFYAGLETVDLSMFDYVCKLDLDLVLPPRYFELLMLRMEAEPRLGTCSGKAYYPGPGNAASSFAGELISEGIGDDVSVGASKFYRVPCFRQIGGFVREVMWDGIDCHRCRMLGWIAGSWDDPELRFIHLRPMGTSHQGIWTGRKRHGFGQYFMGTSLAFITASALYRLPKPPIVLGSVAIWWGYVSSWLSGKPRHGDPAFRRFLRRYQWRALLLGKPRAISRLDREQAPKWDPVAIINWPAGKTPRL
jgi:glycosyltransferase involved in cell wall biosynthesis